MKHGFSKVLGILTVLAIIYGCVVHLGMDFGFGFRSKGKEIDRTYEYQADVKNVKIEAVLVNLKVEEGKEAKVFYSGAEELEPTVTYDAASKTLTVTQTDKDDNRYTNIKDTKNTLRVVIPNGTSLDRCDLFLACGEINVDQLDSKVVSIEDDLGSFRLDGVTADELTIVAALGDVDIDKCVAKNIDVNSSLGDVDIKMDCDISDYSIVANASLGKVKIGGFASSSAFTQAGSAGTIKVECSLGDVKIK